MVRGLGLCAQTFAAAGRRVIDRIVGRPAAADAFSRKCASSATLNLDCRRSRGTRWPALAGIKRLAEDRPVTGRRNSGSLRQRSPEPSPCHVIAQAGHEVALGRAFEHRPDMCPDIHFEAWELVETLRTHVDVGSIEVGLHPALDRTRIRCATPNQGHNSWYLTSERARVDLVAVAE